eukprot:GILI01009649.1.p1 GENE.GILI01009649.1~~GILI01009649.1.p1  ORF type:complete len:306 (+),score=86.58 GILI01009649.1:51-920(+)
MDSLSKGWFSEVGTLWPGQAFSIEVESLLHEEKSEFQHIQVYKSKNYGTMLVLDGVIQCTERDEFSYQEMIVNLPMMAHPNPKRALVIGGGDGGCVRELCKHSCLEQIIMCEIDPVVTQVSRRFLPGMACSLDDPRVTVVNADGAAFMKSKVGEFDVIVVDSSDPIGPAETLFQDTFYHTVKNALRPGGIACFQAECIWLHMDMIRDLYSSCKKIYDSVEYAFTTIPTYPSGQIGFLVCGNGTPAGVSFKNPARQPSAEHLANLKYYTSDVHQAAFALPKFAADALASV